MQWGAGRVKPFGAYFSFVTLRFAFWVFFLSALHCLCTAATFAPVTPDTISPRGNWADWLGLNTSTIALLGTILLVTAATELWSPLIPQYLKSLRAKAGEGDAWTIILIGLYGMYRDGLEALNYYAGGAYRGALQHPPCAPFL